MPDPKSGRFPLGPVVAVALLALVGAAIGLVGTLVGGHDPYAPWNQTRQEAPTNLDAIRTAQKAYHAEFDQFLSADWTPARIPGRRKATFVGPGRPGFLALGWLPDGLVYCRYKTTALNHPTDHHQSDFVAEVECDMDGDGELQRYEANRAQKSLMTSPNRVR